MSRPPIDTTAFMSRYHHPKNEAASKGSSWATISTPYSKAKGMYRQKQVDDELDRIRTFKKPSSSKITITIDNGSNLLQVYHHHHHCLDVELTGGRGGKGRVVWFWKEWETATDERVMKGVITALDSSWSDPNKNAGVATTATSTGATIHREGRYYKTIAAAASSSPIGEKRKRAAVAAESRSNRGKVQQVLFHKSDKSLSCQSQKKEIVVIDLTD